MTTPLNISAILNDLQIKSGPYKNGFEVAPNGRLNWYFTNLGLITALPSLSEVDINALVIPYLTLYIAKVKADYTIDDVNFPQGRANPSNFTLQPSDSDDSYASSFIYLVYTTTVCLGDDSFYQTNKAAIEAIATHNLVNNRKANGLTSVFQYPRRTSYDVGFLMDNCESHLALTSLKTLSGTTAWDASLASIESGLASLFSAADQAFLFSDITSTVQHTFYPDATCQIFPQLCEVNSLSSRFDAGWKFLTKWAPLWDTGIYDSYPWALIGSVAAIRLAGAKSRTQLSYIEGLFVSNRSLVTINEVGFYAYTTRVLASQGR